MVMTVVVEVKHVSSLACHDLHCYYDSCGDYYSYGGDGGGGDDEVWVMTANCYWYYCCCENTAFVM